MLATLDPEMQREQEIFTASRTDTPMTELVTFLATRYKASELLENVQSSSTFSPLQSPHGQLEPRSVNLYIVM